jgi:ribosome recycling factor
MAADILGELNFRMQKAVDGLATELATVRTSRASPALVENIMVDYHGISTPLRQIATISIPEFNLIIIQPWDRTSLNSIDKAILKADIGLNPVNDGNIIRVLIPPLSEERRIKLAKLVSKKVEERRVAIRNIRRDSIGELRQMERSKQMSKDELENTITQVDKITANFIDKASEIGQSKEKEIKEV